MIGEHMTEEEIRRDWRLAKNRDQQILILAELNLVSRRVIKQILSGRTWEEAKKTASQPDRKIKDESAKKPSRRRNKAWSVMEIEMLRQMKLERRSDKDIAAYLGRTVSAVHAKIQYINETATFSGEERIAVRKKSRHRSGNFDDGEPN